MRPHSCGLGWRRVLSFWFCLRLYARRSRAKRQNRLHGSRNHCGQYAPLDMLKSPIFWLLYLMFVLVASSGLMATAQIAPIALDFKLADREVTLLFVTATTLSFALVFDNALNGLACPFFGWISDVIGRENTMAIVFSFGALAYSGLSEFRPRAVHVHHHDGTDLFHMG